MRGPAGGRAYDKDGTPKLDSDISDVFRRDVL